MGVTRPTLRDVAAASGVSPATVSFVLNDSPDQKISAATRERVHQAARTLGYVPHGTARALREGASRIVVLNIAAGQEGNYSRSYIRGLDEELALHRHLLLVRHGDVSDEWSKQLTDTITPRAVLTFGEAYLTGNELADGGWSGGLAANTALQIGHLAERGHRHVAMAVPSGRAALREVRVRFAAQAAEDLGLEPLVSVTVPAPRSAGAQAVEAFRSDHPQVSAVAAFDDDTALRTVAALRDLGMSCPADLAVIGFDATDHGALHTPALTTVHIDAEAHGRIAARSALGVDSSDVPVVAGRLVLRETT